MSLIKKIKSYDKSLNIYSLSNQIRSFFSERITKAEFILHDEFIFYKFVQIQY